MIDRWILYVGASSIENHGIRNEAGELARSINLESLAEDVANQRET